MPRKRGPNIGRRTRNAIRAQKRRDNETEEVHRQRLEANRIRMSQVRNSGRACLEELLPSSENYAMSYGLFAPSPDPLTEDRKCRICGLADLSNTHIFHGNSKILLTKVLAVYPIIMYNNDPLPKHICKKCVSNVNYMYTDIMRVLKVQQKWISNVRSIQPNHKYIKVLDIIEQSNTVTRDSIKATIDVEISEQCINNFLLLNRLNLPKTKNQKRRSFTPELIKMSAECDNDTKNSIAASEEPTAKKQKIKDMKSKLELNGCTLLPVNKKQENSSQQKTTKKTAKNKLESMAKTSESESTVESKNLEIATKIKDEIELIEVKVEPFLSEVNYDEDEDNLTLSQIASTINKPNYSCWYCTLKFKSIKLLAAHQIVHMRVSIPKIFQRKYLHKNIRLGRLITINGDRKCIRCLNCWRIFLDNKSILDHWTLGECEFFCQICGKEFPQAPKMLREHVPAAHGINYRSSKIKSLRLPKRIEQSLEKPTVEQQNDLKIYKTLSEQEPFVSEETTEELLIPQITTCQELTAKTTTTTANSSCATLTSLMANHVAKNTEICPICNQVFNNFKSRNSHMRIHKPQNAKFQFNLSTPKKTNDDLRPTTSTEIKNTNIQGIKVKNLSDLQSGISLDKRTDKNVENLRNSWISLPEPSAATALNDIHIKEETFDGIETTTTTATTTTATATTIKIESLSTRICDLCGQQFTTKLQKQRHKRECVGYLPLKSEN